MDKDIILLGDNIVSLRNIPDNSIDCCVTSPPYYALRDYGTGTWEGGDPNCPHYRTSKASEKTITGHKRMQEAGSPIGDAIYKEVCPICGAVRVDKQVGLEDTPEAYIERLTDIFEEVKRVLKPEGTLWLNIGDSYWGGGWRGAGINEHSGDIQKGSRGTHCGLTMPTCKDDSYKHKDLIGIPWMLAFSLRKAGWYLRQDIIWAKPNPMPESVTDRCTKSHEYIFLLSKSQKYYFDYKAIQEAANPDYIKRFDYGLTGSKSGEIGGGNYLGWRTPQTATIPKTVGIKFGGNKYGDNDDKHYQTYSGKEWIPQIRTQEQGYAKSQNGRDNSGGLGHPTKNCQYDGQEPNTMHLRREEGLQDEVYYVRNKRDVWTVNVSPTKEAHFATYPQKLIQPCILAGCPEGGIVLDPFMGSGTTGMVARKLNRHYIGCELNPEYKAMAERRINECEDLFNQEL